MIWSLIFIRGLFCVHVLAVDGFSVCFGPRLSVKNWSFDILDLWNGFLISLHKCWISLEVHSMIQGAESAFYGTVSIIGVLFRLMVFITFDASSLMIAVVFCMSIGLTVIALRWVSSVFVWCFNYNFCVEMRCNVADIFVIFSYFCFKRCIYF